MKNKMVFSAIPGVSKPVSQLVFGTAIRPFLYAEDCCELLDAVLDAGINTLDTARNYIDVRHSDMYSIQLLLNQMNQQIQFLASNPDFATQFPDMELPQESVRMAIAFVGVLPLIVAFPFFQKYFAKGLTIGGVKG